MFDLEQRLRSLDLTVQALRGGLRPARPPAGLTQPMPALPLPGARRQRPASKTACWKPTARAARAQLRQRGLIPLEVGTAMASDEAPASGWNRQLWRARTFNAVALAVWTRQLAGLVSSGLQLERARGAGRRGRPARTAAPARQPARRGQRRLQLRARALGQFHASSTPVTVPIAAGGGRRPRQRARPSGDDLEGEREALRNKLISAALYPMIVTVFAVVIVVFLMSYVVPQVANVFAGSKRALPTLGPWSCSGSATW